MPSKPDFKINLTSFAKGYSPLAHLDDYTFVGDDGQASTMNDLDIISRPGVLRQGPGLTTLVNGDDTGVVDEKIEFIMDRSVNGGETYGIGQSKLFKIQPNTIVDDTDFPHSITNCVKGESVIDMNGNLFYFYNTSSGGDIGTYEDYSTFNDDWGSSTDKALEKAPHPCASKEDMLLFGNGRYLGVYIEGIGTLNTQKLDFGAGAEVADVVFNSNAWYIVVNRGIDGDNRSISQVYMYDASAISNILSDEMGVGYQKIGFLYVQNGITYVAYEDLSSDGYVIGYLSGRKLEPLRYFNGSLPTHKDKTLYKNTKLFTSGGNIYSCGATVSDLSIQISKHASAKYDDIGGIAAPFGVPMVASTDGSNHDISYFENYTTDSTWGSVVSSLVNGSKRGQVDTIVVITEPLAADARCDIRITGNGGQDTSDWIEISGEGKTRHYLKNISVSVSRLSDVKVEIKWENGSTTANCPIRSITLLGHYVD